MFCKICLHLIKTHIAIGKKKQGKNIVGHIDHHSNHDLMMIKFIEFRLAKKVLSVSQHTIFWV